MKKLINILILLCYFSVTTYSSNINSDFNTINHSEINFLIESKSVKSNSTSIKSIDTADLRPKYRIGFDAPKIDHRQILLTIDENTSDGFDWGYDAEIYQILDDDMYWLIGDKKYVIQATDSISIDKEIPLGIKTVEGGIISIKVDSLENVDANIHIYLKDNELNNIYNIQNEAFQITLPAGDYHERFVITFKGSDYIDNEDTNDEDNSDNETTGDDLEIDNSINDNVNLHLEFIMYTNNINRTIHIKNQQLMRVNSINLYNSLGQKVQSWQTNLKAYNLSLPVNVNSGIYLLQATTENGVISKRIIINNS